MELRAGDFVTDAVRLVRPLAEGGMGRVWIAEHLGLHTQVVVKLMAREMMERDDGATRFAREAAVAAAIKSPHVCQVFDHGVTRAGASTEGIPYIVMELLEGKDLGAVLEDRGRLEPAEAAQVIVQVGKALAKAHKAGIVHRDIKPENIFLCSSDADAPESDASPLHVKLLDFGTAKESRSAATSKATVPGEIMGTPYYMSPEQAIGATVDARSDMWSLGIVAFEMLAGVKPFEGASVGAIALAIHAGLPPITSRVSDLPATLDAWFAKACAQLPHERFENMREMTAAFVEALTGEVTNGDTTEAIVLPRRISVRPSSPPGSGRASSPSHSGADEMRKTLPTSIEPSIPPPAHPHPAFNETASFGSAASPGLAAGLPSDAAVELPSRERAPSGPKPMLDSIAPLTASLPDRRAGQRPTKIAATVVGAAALALMAAIVMHKPAAESASAAAAAPPPATTHAPATPPPMETVVPPPEPEPEPVAAPVHHAKTKKATKPASMPSTPTSTSTPTPAAKGAKKGAAAKVEDDDLTKLIKAGTDPSPAPAPTPIPPKDPAPAPTPIPPKSEPAPAPAPTPLPPVPKPEAPTTP